MQAKYIPQENTYITVDLPGERIRAFVLTAEENLIAVKLSNVPLAKSHTYKQNDIVLCSRVKDMFSEMWKPIEENKNEA